MKLLFEETLPGSWAWSHILKRGTILELTDGTGRACAAFTCFNPLDLSERYNMPDTLKGQQTAVLTTGHALYSDMGRVMLSIVEDGCGGHDPIMGWLTQAAVERRFGVKTYQEFRNAWHQSGQSALLTELGKYGLDQRDLAAVVNFFRRVAADAAGGLAWVSDPRPGATVQLHAAMDTLVVVAATQHPLDPASSWDPAPVGLRILESNLAIESIPAWQKSDQNRRGFANTQLYLQ